MSMALYEVRPRDHSPHKMILCQCCEQEAAIYYKALQWPFNRVRKASKTEAEQHVCLD